MNDPRKVTVADVPEAGRPAGQLTRDGDDLAFGYLPGYDGAPVASTLPVGADDTRATAGAVPPFFAGLLPEGTRLQMLTTSAQTSTDDQLTLLLLVGADAIGDVQVVPGATRRTLVSGPPAGIACPCRGRHARGAVMAIDLHDTASTECPLVGRGTELASIEAALRRARSRPVTPGGLLPGGLLVSGVEGIGKTRLARQAVVLARALGFDSAWVSATRAAAGIPFGAFAHLLPAGPPTDRVQLVLAVARQLAADVGDRPTLLVVDDAHLLDPASAGLVHHLVVGGAAFVLTTVRSDTAVPEAFTTLWKDGLSGRLDLGPLDATGSAQLAVADLGGPVDAVTLRRLWDLAQGNALYLRELLRAGLAGEQLTCRDGVWTWHGPLHAESRLVELLTRRLGGQPGPVQELVDLVALAEPVPLALLERAGIDAADVEDAEAAGLLSTCAVPAGIDVRLAHPLVGEVARERSRPLHRRRLSARLARAVEDTAHGADGRAPADDLRTVLWHLDGGLPLDPRRLLAAGRHALAVLDLPLAERFADAAVRAGAGPAGLLLLATVQVHTGSDVDSVLDRLDRLDLPDQLAARALALRVWTLVFGHGRHAEAVGLLDAAASVGPHTRDQVALARAQLCNLGGDVVRAAELAATVAARPGADRAAVAQACAVQGQALAVQGRHGEAAAAGARALDGGTGGWSMAEEEARGALALALFGAGCLDDARQLVDRSRELSVAAGWHLGAAVWASWTGELALAHGRPRTALAQFREAAAALAEARHPYREWLSRIVMLNLVRAAALCGDADQAASAAERYARLDRPWTRVVDGRDGGVRAWLAIARGEFGRAVDEAVAAADTAAGLGQRGWELGARHLAVRLGAADRVCAEVVRLGRAVDGPLAAVRVRHTLAAADRDGAGLEIAATGFADLGHHLLAAEAWAQAAGVYRARGRLGDATRATATARAIAAGCEGARSPALATLTEPAALTRRETEIARLAAGGRSNREIAGTLVISVRTVDNTLHQVYAKLGLSGRRELRPLFAAQLSGPVTARE